MKPKIFEMPEILKFSNFSQNPEKNFFAARVKSVENKKKIKVLIS